MIQLPAQLAQPLIDYSPASTSIIPHAPSPLPIASTADSIKADHIALAPSWFQIVLAELGVPYCHANQKLAFGPEFDDIKLKGDKEISVLTIRHSVVLLYYIYI